MPIAGTFARLDQYGSMLINEFDETTSRNISISNSVNGIFYASEFSENVGKIGRAHV